jgi:uncharacterized surface protein with fasciclin (FAS1) repeats
MLDLTRGVLLGMLVVAAAVATVGAQPPTPAPTTAPSTQPVRTLAAAINDRQDARIFIQLLQAADMDRALYGPEDLTIFVPSDSAFAKLPSFLRSRLENPTDRRLARRIVALHLSWGRHTYQANHAVSSIRNVAGTPLLMRRFGERRTIGPANVLHADLPASNGTLHMIDRVLLPKQWVNAGDDPQLLVNANDLERAIAQDDAGVEHGGGCGGTAGSGGGSGGAVTPAELEEERERNPSQADEVASSAAAAAGGGGRGGGLSGITADGADATPAPAATPTPGGSPAPRPTGASAPQPSPAPTGGEPRPREPYLPPGRPGGGCGCGLD